MHPIKKVSEPNNYVIVGPESNPFFFEPLPVVERYGSYYHGTYFADKIPCDPEVMKAELLGLEWLTKRTARHEYFMADKDREYVYGNKGTGDEKYFSKPFSKEVNSLRQWLNIDLGTKFNVCFLNKYDDDKQHLGWHADDFEGMLQDEPIAVISFGAEREIWVKRKEETGTVPPEQRIKLQEGSLFLMPVGYQDTHFHRIPKHDRPCGWRISLTFRSFA